MNAGQIKYTRNLLNKLGYDEKDKEELCFIHSDGETTSLRAMNYKQTVSLQNALKDACGIPKELPSDKMRKKIISIAHEMRWHIPGTCKIDMAEVDKWCLTKSGFKKPLDDLNYQELPKAVTMMERVYTAYLKAL